MHKKIKYLIALLGLFSGHFSIGHAQNWKTDLLAMNKTYLNAKSFEMDVVVESYENSMDTKPVVSYKGNVAKKNENYFTRMIGKTTIINKHCVLVVDEKQKIILYKAKNNEKNKPSNFFTLANLDSTMIMMAKGMDVTYLTNNAIEKSIQITQKGNSVSKTEIIINTITNTLSQITYYSEKAEGKTKTSTKTIVKYNNIKIDENIPDELFSEKKYIHNKTGGMSLSKDYSNYQLVDESQNSTP